MLYSIVTYLLFNRDLVIIKFQKHLVCQDLPSLFIREVSRLLWIDNSAVMKLLQLFLHFIINFLFRYSNSLFDIVLGKDGLICDDVFLQSRLKKYSYGVDDVDICLGNIMEVTGTNNQVDTHHGALIGSFIIVVDGGRITQVISFLIRRQGIIIYGHSAVIVHSFVS